MPTSPVWAKKPMNNELILSLALYFVCVSAFAAVLSVLDKKKAKKKKWRIPESALIAVAVLGGALAEYVTMKKIHHKTRHKKFMVGLPLIMALHVLLIIGAVYYL